MQGEREEDEKGGTFLSFWQSRMRRREEKEEEKKRSRVLRSKGGIEEGTENKMGKTEDF